MSDAFKPFLMDNFKPLSFIAKKQELNPNAFIPAPFEAAKLQGVMLDKDEAIDQELAVQQCRSRRHD